MHPTSHAAVCDAVHSGCYRTAAYAGGWVVASFAGEIAGLGGTNGAMIKSGIGNLTLAGTSSLGWTIEAGGLTTAEERFTGNAAILSGANLAFDQGTDANYAGTLSGTGMFEKQGLAPSSMGAAAARLPEPPALPPGGSP